ncbi:TIGR03936 family radical SAM-associated protein [Actinoalloteichus hymeniacidonis]|uniref:TIGR03936 family radical SAM-associated protein n=1 Tax=Actinoalloteichus hymeniacidonis TaxID=340345 RepID=UPI0008538B06|nr:TIGR03936 family radical SAM-associated protein [Actinoalloteichus hymeniacidonis]
MQRLRLRFAKRERLRFTSHRDVARSMERALRRAGVPMAYSQGFNPHPKVSWAGAAPTGAASEAEYVELALAEVVDPLVLARELDTALPPGLDVVEATVAGPGSLAERLTASCWRIDVPGIDPEALRAATELMLAESAVQVERMTKNGLRAIDARAAIVRAEVLSSESDPETVSATVSTITGESTLLAPAVPTSGAATNRSGEPATQGDEVVARRAGQLDRRAVQRPYGILVAVVRQVTPTVRPDDVLSALRVVAAVEPPVPAKATRMAQGRLDDDGRLVDPLTADRAVARAESGVPCHRE